MKLQSITKTIYALTGLFFLIIGIPIVTYKTGLLPVAIGTKISNAAQGNVHSLHLLQEYGAMMVFAGVLSIWFIKDYSHSKNFHWGMTIFWGIMAIIHWTDAITSGASLVYPIANTIPFLLYVTTGFLRKQATNYSQLNNQAP